MPTRYSILYAPNTVVHVAAIERKYHSLIRKTIEEQLQYEPGVRVRNRKPLTKPTRFGMIWELRFGPDNMFRVFYRAEEEAARVRVLAIATKIGEKLFIGGKEFVL